MTEDNKIPVSFNGSVKPVFLKIKNETVRAVSDGKGNAYRLDYSHGYDFEKYIREEGLISPDEYEFVRGWSGFDF